MLQLMDNYVGVIVQRFIFLTNNLKDVIFKVLPRLFENDTGIIKELGGCKNIDVFYVNIK